MRGLTAFPRAWLCVPAATLGAALADLWLESASNAGLFGPGRFTDGSNADLAPVLVIGLALAGALLLRFALVVTRHTRRGLRTARPTAARGAACDVWVEVCDGLRGPHRMRDLVAFAGACYALQIVILYSMENAEQVAVYGRILGPWLWLGAPAGLALIVHALVCVGIIALLGVSLRGVLTCAPRLVHAIAYYRRRVRRASCVWHTRRRRTSRPALPAAPSGSRGQRSPPRLDRPSFLPGF